MIAAALKFVTGNTLLSLSDMSSTAPTTGSLPMTLADASLIAGTGLLLGLMHLVGVSPISLLIAAPVLLGLFQAFNLALRRTQHVRRGLLMGMLMGVLVGGVGLALDGAIVNVGSGVMWGSALGFGLGAVVGLVSRVAYNDQDTFQAKLFLFAGSIGLGAGLGAGVGLITGLILGGIAQSWAGTFLALLAGGVVGGYLGSYFHQSYWIAVGVVAAVAVTAVSISLGGAFAGLVLGSIAGSFAPILLVAAIGAAGGLLARGLRAMVVEALEAPTEMLEQGASPYLLPAVVTGGVVGAMTAGPDGLVVLAAAFGLLGLLFGGIIALSGRPGSIVTIRSLVEMAMIGGDDWPFGRTVGVIFRENGRRALVGVAVGGVLSLAGAVSGWLLAVWLMNVFAR